jgi:hypothetical protein
MAGEEPRLSVMEQVPLADGIEDLRPVGLRAGGVDHVR